MKIKQFIKNEISGWSFWEILWVLASAAVIIALSLYWGDSLMGIISSTTGVMYVVFAGKGKLSAYIFGLVNSVLYAIISFEARYYGETMLNAVYYVPMQFVGFYVWSKNMNGETYEVEKRHMKNPGRIWLVLAIAASTYIYGLILQKLGDAMPFVDSFTTAASVIAMIVSVKRFAEQWWIWLVVDILSVYMWWVNFSAGNDNIATLLMWIMYVGNAVIITVKWERDIRACKEAQTLIDKT